MTESMDEAEFRALSAGHALHALSPADEERFLRAAREHPEWTALVAEDTATAALLGMGAAAEDPPPAVRGALLARIAEDTVPSATGASAVGGPVAGVQGAGEDEPAAGADRHPRRRSRRLFALAASVALIAALGVGAATLLPAILRPAAVVALEQIEQAPDARQRTAEVAQGGSVTAHWSSSLGRAVLVTEGMAALPDDKAYELWFVRGDEPISAGLLSALDGTAALEGAFRDGDLLAITVERAGGSATGAPTTDPIVAIPTS